jgi:hypothetical protein
MFMLECYRGGHSGLCREAGGSDRGSARSRKRSCALAPEPGMRTGARVMATVVRGFS